MEKIDLNNLKSGNKSDVVPGAIIFPEKPKLYNHKELPINIDGKVVNIDEELVEVIAALNKVGLKTEFCCQGRHERERAYIVIDASNVEFVVKNRKIILRWARQVRSESFHPCDACHQNMLCICRKCGKEFAIKDRNKEQNTSPCCNEHYIAHLYKEKGD